MEVIEAGFGIVVVAAVAEGILLGHAAGLRENIAPSIILIRGSYCAILIDELDHVALQIQDVVIRVRLGAQLVDHGKRLARLVIDKIHHGSDGLIGCDRLAHDLAALRQIFMRDRLRRGQVRASRRNGVLIRRLFLNRLDLVHGHDLAGRPCR